MRKAHGSHLRLSIRQASEIRLTMKPGMYAWSKLPGEPPTDSTFHSFSEIVGHLERQYDDILAEESRIKRNPRFRDNRVHALLYFITPTGHG